MKKILAIMLLGLSISVSADVLDSEQTDYEFENENCINHTAEECITSPVPFMLQHRSNFIPIIFNTRLNSGYYRFDNRWYWQHTGIRFFNPVRR